MIGVTSPLHSSMSSRNSREGCSVHQPWLQHRFHHLILSNQFVAINRVRVYVQSRSDVSVTQHGLHGLDVGFGLGDQIGSERVAEIMKSEATPVIWGEDP